MFKSESDFVKITSALFMVAVLYGSIVTPTAFAVAETIAPDSHGPLSPPSIPTKLQAPSKVPHTSTKPPIGKMPDASDYPAGKKATKSKTKAAVDASPLAADPLAVLGKTEVSRSEPQQGVAPKTKITPHELTDRRTATTTESVNADGSITKKQYTTPQFFKKDSQWSKIDTSLIEDKNAGDAGTVFGRALGQVESWMSSATNFVVKDNDWQARFSPSDSSRGMVRIKQGNSQIGYAPVNAKSVAPVITTDSEERQTVHYYDLWPGVNVEYVAEAGAVKENIVIKDKNATSSVSFKVVGASLKKQKSDEPGNSSIYMIKGALNDEFAIASPNLVLNNFGPETKEGIFTQTYANDTITVSVDQSYLQSLPDKAFPAVVDPTTFKSTFGTRAGGNYVSFKSDGYVCGSTTCNPYAGSLYDSGYTLRYWRSAFYVPYDQFRSSSNVLTNATLHLTQRTNAGFWTGTYDTHNFQVGHATCTNNYNCLEGGTFNASGNLATVGNINVTNIYQAMISRGDFGAWLMLAGQDGTYSSFKNFDPDNTYVSFTYGGPPSAPSIATPTTNQVYVDPQPSFRVNTMPNPNGSTPLQYEILVSSGLGGSGALTTSSLLGANTTQWTIPDGILQDGSTYYVQARSYDPITGTYSSWGTSVPFRIDMRTGKDKTQAFDTLGPVGVDLATGNVTTSTSSHASTALGGGLGVGLDYNSPLRSRTGLVGRYWNVPTNWQGGLPTGTPAMTRVDQNIDFDWTSGSPASGTIGNDGFYSRWDGYFVAPTSGTYYFGSNTDDWMKVVLNSSLLYQGTCFSGKCYGSSITLQAGQVVSIAVDYQEMTGPAYAHLYVKGPVDEKAVPSDWLQTGVRQVSTPHGLTGSYYGKFDGTDTFSTNNALVMKRTDSNLNFSWGSGSPVPNGPEDFLVRWSGYVTVPVSGTYNFGSVSDDGTKIMLGTSNTVVYNDWTTHGATEGYGSGFAMTANQPVPITIEYFDHTGPASFQFKVQGAVPTQLVPTNWLSPKAQVLPDGWNLGLDADGSLSYDHLTPNQNSAVLTDSAGDRHEYTWTGTGYKPPVNEDGNLVRNADGTFTLQDVDGRIYVFAADGTLSSVTNPVDDRNPAALQYTYASVNNGPAALTQITDGVDSSRWAKVYYSGDSNCGTAPAGFDVSAPSGMLCAVKTNDGRATYFYYIQSQLARIMAPGNQMTDYRYESVTNGSGAVVGYRLNDMRNSLAMDAIAAGVRADDITADTQLTYDVLGRVTSVTQPAATTGATRPQATVEYLPGAKSYEDANGNTVPGYFGLTKEHVVGATEPNGFSRQVKYDNLFRTIEDRDIANLATTTEWDAAKDLVYSVTNPLGLKSTTIYDDEDRPVSGYGAAPVAWFGADRKPLTAYASQVPRVDAGYDEGIVGPAVAWTDYTKQTGNTNGLLSGAPKLHTTGVNTTTPGVLSYAFTSPPVTASTGAQGIGFSATGKLRIPNSTYTISATTADGIKVWVDDQVVLDSWIDGVSRTVTGTNFTIDNATTSAHRFRLDVYRRTGTTGTLDVRIQQQGGFAATDNWANYLQPDYSLPTSSKAYDSTIGDTTAMTNYGSTPELGLPVSSTLDPTGLNLTGSAAHETPGAAGSFLRLTSSTLPAGNTTSYSYYGAAETADNPCTTGVTETYKQGGEVKLKTEPDPDGSGPQTPRTTQIIYDDAGNIVATRYNNDSWTCTTYDGRGRVSTISVPAFSGEAARTINNNYAVADNPLETTTWDGNGWIVKWCDILGRLVKYRDVHDDETTYTYDNLGNLTQKDSPVGTETYEYDSYYRLTDQKLDGTTYATLTYDQYGRVDHVDYPNAGQMKSTPGRDSMQRSNSVTYQLGDGTTEISDTTDLTQSSRVHTDLVESGTQQLSSTFGYDGAGRLTSAAIGPHTYSYGFGTQDSSCGSGSNMNPNAGKNSNRTSQTIDGTTTNFCYDYADRLVSSSDPTANYTEYDSHGNTTYIGTGSTPLRLCYDSSDRNYCLASYDSNQTDGDYEYYSRDVANRITYRQHETITNGAWNTDAEYWYGYTGDGGGSSFIRNANWDVVEKTVQLPGGVMMTVKPQQTGTNQKQYSLPSALGRTMLTTDATGTNTSTGNGPLSSFTYDPFGNILPGSSHPDNTAGGSYGFGGSNQKLTATSIALAPIQMGARVYIPSIGRFLSVDPIQGGTANNYVYASDPVNGSDYTGMSMELTGYTQNAAGAGTVQNAAGAPRVQNAAPPSVFYGASHATIYIYITRTPVPVRAPAKPAAPHYNNSTALPAAKVNKYNITKLKPVTPIGQSGPPSNFSAQTSASACLGVCLTVGQSSGINGMHLFLGLGFGPKAGITAGAGASPGSVTTGGYSEASCQLGAVTGAVTIDGSSEGHGYSVGVSAPTEVGCAYTLGYTF